MTMTAATLINILLLSGAMLLRVFADGHGSGACPSPRTGKGMAPMPEGLP
jgi:hypothetical protein